MTVLRLCSYRDLGKSLLKLSKTTQSQHGLSTVQECESKTVLQGDSYGNDLFEIVGSTTQSQHGLRTVLSV
ncbi:unnamed protein product [Timema podura]|uniref:Uncharacterized protein n=1 Tax=Timema podura TaxID=61482 RepID=A0ABN7NJW3_TIMPD|nr:unnamed protein product [Timema podura]